MPADDARSLPAPVAGPDPHRQRMLRLVLATYAIAVTAYIPAFLIGNALLKAAAVPIILLSTVTAAGVFILLPSARVPPPAFAAILSGVGALLAFLTLSLTRGNPGAFPFMVKATGYHFLLLLGLLLGASPRRRVPDPPLVVILMILAAPALFYFFVAEGRDTISVLDFFNRNSFSAYVLTASIVLLPAVSSRWGMGVRAYFLVTLGLLLGVGTLGAILFFVLATAFFVLYGRERSGTGRSAERWVLLVLAVAVASAPFLFQGLLSEFPILDRINRVGRTIAAIIADRGLTGLVNSEMADLVPYAVGDRDMSALFRVLHSLDIFRLYASGSPAEIVFGKGVGWINASRDLFVYPVAAHNEWLRILVELGAAYAAFVAFLVFRALWTLRRSVVFIPLAASTLLFATENLLNNFLATSFFFFLLGFFYSQQRLEAWTDGVDLP